MRLNVSHKYQCIFVHVPKTAGLSFRETGLFDTYVGHVTAMQMRKTAPDLWQKYFTFAFVRDVLDRFVSAYSYLLSRTPKNDPWWGNNRRSAKIVKSFASFDDFVRGFSNTDLIRKDYHFRPQAAFVCDKKGRCLVDFLGRFWRIDTDTRYVFEKIGFPNIELPAVNASKHKPYEEYYSDETAEIVQSLYPRDVELIALAEHGRD